MRHHRSKTTAIGDGSNYTKEESDFLNQLVKLRVEIRTKFKRYPTMVEIFQLSVKVYKKHSVKKDE